MTKTCTKCGQRKQLAEFYFAKKGPMSACKECWKAQVIARRRSNPAVQAYDRERAKLPHRREHAKRQVEAWNSRNPERRAAEVAICNAVRDGRLDREPCDRCGTDQHVFGIAQDLERPLARVLWRCATCYHRSRFEAAPTTEARA